MAHQRTNTPPIFVLHRRHRALVHQFIGNGLLVWAHGYLDHHELVQSHRSAGQALAQAMGGRLMLSDWFEAVTAGHLGRAGRHEEAIELAQKVVAQAQAAKLPMSLGIGLRALGSSLMRMHRDRFVEAQQHFEDSITAFESGGIAAEIARTHVTWSESCTAADDLDGARQHLGIALRMFDEFGFDYARRETEQRLAK